MIYFRTIKNKLIYSSPYLRAYLIKVWIQPYPPPWILTNLWQNKFRGKIHLQSIVRNTYGKLGCSSCSISTISEISVSEKYLKLSKLIGQKYWSNILQIFSMTMAPILLPRIRTGSESCWKSMFHIETENPKKKFCSVLE